MAAPPIFTPKGVMHFTDVRPADIGEAIRPMPPPEDVQTDGDALAASASVLDPMAALEQRVLPLSERISGASPPPNWLCSGLARGLQALRFARQDEAQQASYPQVRRQLTKLGKDIVQLANELAGDDPANKAVMAAVEAAHEDGFSVLGQAWRSLMDLQPIVEAAIKAVPGQRGQHKYRAGENAPRVLCAIIVAVSWRAARNEWPGHTATAAQEACRDLWLVAGGEARGYGGSQALNGWRTHLRRAKAELEDGQPGHPKVENFFREKPAF